MNLKTVIAASLLTLAAATAAHASDRDAYPRPDWNPNASDYLYKPAQPAGMSTASLDERMRATGSGTEYCTEPYALNPREGTNGHAGLC